MTRAKGFTIVELLIVVVVIAILAAITIVSYNGITKQARQAVLANSARSVMQGIEVHRTLTGSYPVSLDGCPVPGADSLCLPQGGSERFTYKAIAKGSRTGETVVANDTYEVTIEAGSRVMFFSPAERTNPTREFVQYVNLAPIIDKYGLVPYTLSFDIKSADPSNYSNVRAYFQNGTYARHGGLYVDVDVTDDWQHKEVDFTATFSRASETMSVLAFYGNYTTGNRPIVRNVKFELR